MAPPRAFATTRWSVVLRAGGDDAAEAQAALARLCAAYWYPLYAHVRRRGRSVHDAQDLTQAFFAMLLRRGAIGRADPERGRFRSFLLTALDRFLRDEWEKERAERRGGGGAAFSLDVEAAERRLQHEPVTSGAPDRAFDRRWALALLDAVLLRLERDYEREGKGALFARIKSTLQGGRDTQPYVVLAEELGLTEGAVKAAVHRLRRRYRDVLRAEIAETVATPEDAEAELKDLFRALAADTP